MNSKIVYIRRDLQDLFLNAVRGCDGIQTNSFQFIGGFVQVTETEDGVHLKHARGDFGFKYKRVTRALINQLTILPKEARGVYLRGCLFV